MEPVIEVKSVTKRFNDVVALSDVSFSLDKGIYGIIGPNGAGKSTLFHIMTTLMECDEGSVLYNGVKIKDLKGKYRAEIGYMPQAQRGYEHMKAIQFLYYIAALKGLKKQEAYDQITQLAKQVSLENDLHKKIGAYSGGMRQRLLFIQALLGNPSIIILDEPTAGLDPYERIKMRNYIAEVSEDKIVIIATHVMQDIEFIAKEVVLLCKGKIKCKGSCEQLIESLNGHVHEKVVKESELDAMQEQYKIARITRTNEGLLVRYIQKEAQEGYVIADMEDVYLYYMM